MNNPYLLLDWDSIIQESQHLALGVGHNRLHIKRGFVCPQPLNNAGLALLQAAAQSNYGWIEFHEGNAYFYQEIGLLPFHEAMRLPPAPPTYQYVL